MREVMDTIELAEAISEVDVSDEEYARLLGYPRGVTLEGRARELADWARAWYAEHGRPWIYARQAESFVIEKNTIDIDGAQFTSSRLQATLEQAGAHSVILVAVGAGAEAEEEARRRWVEEKPDEYFFWEMYASAVVERLVTVAGARLCDWAEQRGMAVLPHYSPGYSEWDVAEQPRLLELLKQTRSEQFPSLVDVFETGMLRPKKTLLAVFGLTKNKDRFERLTNLIPCERCAYAPCQYRRAPFRRNPRPVGEVVSLGVSTLDKNAKYTVNRKALERWTKERLRLHMNDDGTVNAEFRYDGTTCTNMGRALAFIYHVKLGNSAEGYPIRMQRCIPAEGDEGHRLMCKYTEDPGALMGAIERERPLAGENLDAVLAWRRTPSAAGCYCEPESREHKWGLVFETIHYALVQKERELE
ncbi:MAG TPA: hypothetical protein VME23_04875 [Terracidiphilus sp.]|nr:hypothetical protein [Terracidiphilus sp.]